MTQDTQTTPIRSWLNVALVTCATLSCGAIFALMYLLVPLFFAGVAALYLLKFTAELLIWRKLSPQDRADYSAPGHFMNFNHTLSVKLEWLLVGLGFLAVILWVTYARATFA